MVGNGDFNGGAEYKVAGITDRICGSMLLG